jgi:DNA-binding ferritin-like protein
LLLDTLESALDTGDVGTEYMLNQMIFNLEKRHWMYNAYLKE